MKIYFRKSIKSVNRIASSHKVNVCATSISKLSKLYSNRRKLPCRSFQQPSTSKCCKTLINFHNSFQVELVSAFTFSQLYADEQNQTSNQTFLHLHITVIMQRECNLYAVKKPQMFIAEAQSVSLSIATIINFILIAELL